MIISSRIDRACARDNSRYALSGIAIYARGPAGVPVAATDGHILAVTYGDDGDGNAITPGIYPPPPKAGKVIAMKNGGGECWYGTGATDTAATNKLLSSPTVGKPVEGQFPPISDLLEAKHLTAEETQTITINAEFLARLAEAIGDGGVVTIAFNPKQMQKPFAVISADTEGVGLLMPVKSSVSYENVRERLDRAARSV